MSTETLTKRRYRVALAGFTFQGHVDKAGKVYLRPSRDTKVQTCKTFEVEAVDENHAKTVFMEAMGITRTMSKFSVKGLSEGEEPLVDPKDKAAAALRNELKAQSKASAELQERLARLEAGFGDAKATNEALAEENDALRERLAKLEAGVPVVADPGASAPAEKAEPKKKGSAKKG